MFVTLLVLGGALALAVRPWPTSTGAQCRVPEAEREAVATLAALREREATLRTELANLRDGLVAKQANCPKPMARVEPPAPPVASVPPAPVEETPPPPPVALAPPPPAPSPPRDELLRLPANLELQRDLGFLRGCWISDPFRHQRTQAVPGLSEYCFDALGRGTLVWRREAVQCRSGAQAVVASGGLDIADTDATCSDGTRWFGDRLVCRAGASGVAQCSGETFDPVGGRMQWTVRLHRRN